MTGFYSTKYKFEIDTMSFCTKYMYQIVLLFIAAVGLTVEVHSFGPGCITITAAVSSNRQQITRMLMSDDGEDTTAAPPQPIVKCPNCDKCDGSGR